MDAASDFDFEAPIWWDPKVRRSIYDPFTFPKGMLVLLSRVVTVATVDGLVCSADLDSVRVSWPEVFDLPSCDLEVGGRVNRVFFCAPHPRTPLFDGHVPPAVSAVLEAQQGRGRLASAHVPSARWPSQTTEPMARKRMEAFRRAVRAGVLPDQT